jgi:hypothetical protein
MITAFFRDCSPRVPGCLLTGHCDADAISFVLTSYTAAAPTPAIPYQPGQEPTAVACDGVVRYGTHPE